MTKPRNRGIVRLDEETLHRALNLPENQQVIGFRTDPVSLSIDVCVEGEGLPEVLPGCEAPRVDAAPYVSRMGPWMLRGSDLEEAVRALATWWSSGRHADAAAALLRVLDEGWRLESPAADGAS